jgi:threonine/homoserine/homoserine lactone efflux protein
VSLVYGALVTMIVTIIVTESYLFGPVRSLAHRVSRHLGVLFGCFLCFGTWVGLAVGWLLPGEIHWALAGLAYQGLAYLIWTGVRLVDDLRIKLQR